MWVGDEKQLTVPKKMATCTFNHNPLHTFSFSPGGFGAALADHFQRKCDVLNRGFSGYTTRSNKLILPKLLKIDNNPPGCILAAVILLGTNDCEDVNAKCSRYVPIDEYKQNLKNICQQFSKADVPFEKQILITPPAMNEQEWTVFCRKKGVDMTMDNEWIKPCARACLEVGEELKIEVFDLWSEMQKISNWKDMLSDGLHFSEMGNDFVSKRLIPMLDHKLPHLTDVYPDWTYIYPKNPEKILLNKL